MTRARDRLYVIGSQNNKKTNTKTWYSCIKESVLSNPEHKIENDNAIKFSSDIFEEDKAVVLGGKEDGIISNVENKIIETNEILPKFFDEKLPDLNNFNTEIIPVSPFESYAEKITPRSRGVVIHKLLEYISKTKSPNMDIKKIIDSYVSKIKIDDADFIKNNILELYNNPKYNFIFNDNSLSETEIITNDNNISQLLRVDKIVFDNNEIWIIDYKTDKLTNNIPSSYKKQLAKYKNALAKIYPNKKIHTAILWINDLKLVEII